jgi:hypothetical protein
VPPEPNVPQPPNPTAYVNAFSPPPAPPGQNPMMPMTPEQQQAMMQHHAMMQYQAMLQHHAMMQRMQQPQMAQLMPMMPGAAPMQVGYPASYNGPQPPNPVAPPRPMMMPIQPVGFNPAGAAGLNLAAVNPAMDRRGLATAQQPAADESAKLGQLISVLQQSSFPAQREWAATNLSTFDHRLYPHLTQVLMQAARQDAAATVRAAAVYSLSRMNVQSEAVLGTLQALRGDADPRVRQEVEQAYTRMGVTPPAAQK